MAVATINQIDVVLQTRPDGGHVDNAASRTIKRTGERPLTLSTSYVFTGFSVRETESCSFTIDRIFEGYEFVEWRLFKGVYSGGKLVYQQAATSTASSVAYTNKQLIQLFGSSYQGRLSLVVRPKPFKIRVTIPAGCDSVTVKVGDNAPVTTTVAAEYEIQNGWGYQIYATPKKGYLVDYDIDNPLVGNIAGEDFEPVITAREAWVNVTLDPDDATVATQTARVRLDYAYGSLPEPSYVASKKFLGYYTERKGKGTKITSATIVTLKEDHTLYAHWGNRALYPITIVPGEGISRVGVWVDGISNRWSYYTGRAVVEAYEGRWVALFAEPESGYVYPYNSTSNCEYINPVTGPATYNPLGVQPGVTYLWVNFDANGGSVSTSSKRVGYGSTYGKLPVASKSGYFFLGWYTSETGGNRVTASSLVNTTTDHTLYAHWREGDYIVVLHKNDGSDETTTLIFYEDEEQQLPEIGAGLNWAREGFNNPGWALSASSSSVAYTDGQRVTNIGEYGDTIDLYAVWVAINFTITFDANGGSVTPGSKTVANGASYGELPIPVWEGFKFEGWYSAASGGYKIASSDRVSGNVTIYAIWSPERYMVAFDPQGGVFTNILDALMALDFGEALGTLPQVRKRGYTFDGWWTAATGGERVSAGAVLSLTDDATLFAHWI